MSFVLEKIGHVPCVEADRKWVFGYDHDKLILTDAHSINNLSELLGASTIFRKQFTWAYLWFLRGHFQVFFKF